MKDLISNVEVLTALKTADVSGNTNGEIIDTQGAASLTFAAVTGAITSSGKYTVKLEHGDASNLSDAADVDSADILGDLPAAELAADSTYSFGYRGSKRYVRLVASKVSGTSILVGAVAVKGHLALAGAM